MSPSDPESSKTLIFFVKRNLLLLRRLLDCSCPEALSSIAVSIIAMTDVTFWSATEEVILSVSQSIVLLDALDE
jgi:hypothetical protein